LKVKQQPLWLPKSLLERPFIIIQWHDISFCLLKKKVWGLCFWIYGLGLGNTNHKLQTPNPKPHNVCFDFLRCHALRNGAYGLVFLVFKFWNYGFRVGDLIQGLEFLNFLCILLSLGFKV
jgi:hypothetical protein